MGAINSTSNGILFIWYPEKAETFAMGLDAKVKNIQLSVEDNFLRKCKIKLTIPKVSRKRNCRISKFPFLFFKWKIRLLIKSKKTKIKICNIFIFSDYFLLILDPLAFDPKSSMSENIVSLEWLRLPGKRFSLDFHHQFYIWKVQASFFQSFYPSACTILCAYSKLQNKKKELLISKINGKLSLILDKQWYPVSVLVWMELRGGFLGLQQTYYITKEELIRIQSWKTWRKNSSEINKTNTTFSHVAQEQILGCWQSSELKKCI